MAKALKTRLNLLLDSSIAAGATDNQPGAIVPVGKVVTLKRFGASLQDGANGSASIQWGAAGPGQTWTTLRTIQREHEFSDLGEFTGDGVKRFRLVRVNRAATATVIVAWMDAIVHDA